MRFRRANVELIESLRPHWKDRPRYVEKTREGRQQLVEQFARELEAKRQAKAREDWDADEHLP